MSGFEILSPSAPETLRGHRNAVVWVLWIHSKQLLVTAGEDKSVRVWNIQSRKAVKSFYRCFEEDIDALYHFTQFENIIFASTGPNLILLNLDSDAIIDTIPLSILSFPADVSSVALTAAGSRLVLGDDDGTIRCYSIQRDDASFACTELFVLENAHKNIVSHLLFYERTGKSHMLSSSYDCSCILWVLEENATALARVDFANLGEVRGQVFNPPFVHGVVEVDEDFLLAALGDGSVKVFRKQDLLVMDGQEFHNHQTISLCKMGNDFISTGLDGTIQVFNTKKTTKKEKGRVKTKIALLPSRSFRHSAKVNSSTVISNEDGRYLIAVADVGDVVSLYSADNF